MVTKELSSGDVQVAVNGKRWIMNPCCLLPAPGDKSIVTADTGTTTYQYVAFVLKPSLISLPSMKLRVVKVTLGLLATPHSTEMEGSGIIGCGQCDYSHV